MLAKYSGLVCTIFLIIIMNTSLLTRKMASNMVGILISSPPKFWPLVRRERYKYVFSVLPRPTTHGYHQAATTFAPSAIQALLRIFGQSCSDSKQIRQNSLRQRRRSSPRDGEGLRLCVSVRQPCSSMRQILLWKSTNWCYMLVARPRFSIVLSGWPDLSDSTRKGIRFNEAFCIA
jgi:hypothetical protein